MAVKESFERFSCLEFIFGKANTGQPAYRMKNINKDFQRHFNTCLCEWKLLSLYMFHRIIFVLLIVSSLFCNFYRCAVCFPSLMNISCMLEYLGLQTWPVSRQVLNQIFPALAAHGIPRNYGNLLPSTMNTTTSGGLTVCPRTLPGCRGAGSCPGGLETHRGSTPPWSKTSPGCRQTCPQPCLAFFPSLWGSQTPYSSRNSSQAFQKRRFPILTN